jgi:hypothetical protein
VAVIIEDSFEAYTVGAAPGGTWVVRDAAGGGAVTVENDPAAGAARGKVLRVLEGTDSGALTDYSEAKLPFGTTKDELTAVFEIFPLQASKTLFIGFYVGATRFDVLRFSTIGTIQYKNNVGTWTALPTAFIYSSSTWLKIRLVINRSATTAELVMTTIGEVDKQSAALNLPDFGGSIDAIAFATEVAEDGSSFYVSDVQVIDRTALIEGTVRDQSNTPVSGARVLLWRHTSDVILATQLTNASGEYSFSIDSGIYVAVFGYHPSVTTQGGSGRSRIWAR